MTEFLYRRFFVVRHNYTNPVDRQRANALFFINWATFGFWLMWLSVTWLTTVVVNRSFIEAEYLLAFIPLPFIFLTTYFSLQSGRLRFASWFFVGFLFLNVIIPSLGQLNQSGVILLVLPLSAAGLLLGRRGVVITLLFILFVVLIGGAAQSQLVLPESEAPAETLELDLLLVLTGLIFVALFLYVFGGNSQRLIRQSMDDVRVLQKIGRFAIQLPRGESRSVYAALLNLLVGDMRYDFVQLFLADSNGVIRQRVRIGLSGGQTVVLSDVQVERSSALNDAIQQKVPVLISRREPEIRRTHLQYTMLFGLAVPLVAGESVLGVIDVQKNNEAFSDADVAVLTMLAEQVASLLRDLETISTLRTNLNEQETTINNLRNRLSEFQQQERQVMSSAWDVYLQQRGEEAIGFDLDGGFEVPLPARGLPDMLRPALRAPDVSIEKQGNEQVITVPIRLHGNILGAMAFAMPADTPITRRQLEMARKVANRLALALENKRLFEQSQSQANRERKANEIANLLIGATDVDSVMNLAVSEFNDALGAIRTRIHIQPGAFKDQKLTLRQPPVELNDGGGSN